ncbi:MAG: hypothetical protein HOP11_04755 [Saprospiraceae bacterium]|nr:hypothetical protein [Saprospiraceae bacterium]
MIRYFSIYFISILSLQAQLSHDDIKVKLSQIDPLWKKADFIIQSNYYDDILKCEHIYIQERISGKPVYPEISQLHLSKENKVLQMGIHSPRYSLLERKDETKLSHKELLKIYLEQKQIYASIIKENSRSRIENNFENYSIEKMPNSKLIIQDCYYYNGITMFSACRIQFHNELNDNLLNSYISRSSGQVIFESRLTHDCGWSEGSLEMNKRFSIEHKNEISFNSNCYRVFPIPTESPNHGARTVVNSPWQKAANASPLGWHNDGLFNYQSTQGNNVDCYEDMDADNLPTGGDAARAVGGANLNFDFTLNPSLFPPANKNASLTNMFYWTNINHDIWYQYGFNEASGNFQYQNFGKGGLDLDNVIVEGLDQINGSRNNANYSCPPDGYPSRLQMYVWQLPVYDTVQIDYPLNINGKIVAVQSAISPSLLAPLQLEVILVNDGSGFPTQGCNPYINAAQVNGKIALLDRGICNINEKILNAQNAGALAMLICSVDDNAPTVMGGFSGGVGLPIMNISKYDGDLIKSQLHQGVYVTMMPSSALKFVFNAKSYSFARASFGGKIPTNLNADIINVFDGAGNPYDACDPIWNNINNSIALIQDGNCEPSYKALQAQQAGAVAVIIGMNTPGLPYLLPAGSYGHLITIPVICISQVDYNEITNQLPGQGRFANLLPQLVDGNFDGGIITHEYAHGISIRLTGGPNNNLCLNNAEQAGEGWSDYLAMVMTMKSSDVAYQNRGIGVWASGHSNTGVGLRPYPYNVDLQVNPATYGKLQDRVRISQPHGIGYVWCSMIWDLTWALIKQYGFEADLYKSNSSSGNIKAINLVMSGLKLQACNPGFVDSRNAILKADSILNNGVNSCLIWNIFARRGLGWSANQGSSFSRDDGTEAFDLPSGCSFMSEDQLFGNSVLSIHDVKLTAEKNNENIILNWKSNVASKIQRIEIYRISGNNSLLIHTLMGDGTQFVDNKFPKGNLIYQIKVFYETDKMIESNRAIVRQSEGNGWKISPVPANDFIYLNNSETDNTELKLYIMDLNSKVIDQSILYYKKNERVKINISDLVAGTYWILIESSEGIEKLQCLKN